MNKLTATKTFEIDLTQMKSYELQVKYLNTWYEYDSTDNKWLYCDKLGDESDIVIEDHIIEILNRLLKKEIEDSLWSDIQEEIENEVRGNSKVDFDFEWDRLEHQDYVNTNQMLITEIERLREEIEQYKERIINLTSK